MKRKLLALFCLAATVVSTASAQVPLHTDLYPLKVGSRWRYRTTDPQSKDTKSEVTVSVAREESYERAVKDKKGNKSVEKFVGYILESKSKDKTTYDHVVVTDEGVQRVKVAGIPILPPVLFFKLPLKAGEKWEVDSVNNNMKVKGTFTWHTEKITVPAGTFDAVVISLRDGPENNTRIELDSWYVRDIGLAKQRIKTKNHENILELEHFDKAK